jgi:NAD(P)-dependent dehydrogenase (short-subunit alcohol dehydrogenase family)
MDGLLTKTRASIAQGAKALDGRTVLVSGGAAGMGGAASALFAAAGARVAILDIQADRGAALAQAITEAGGAATYINADVSDAAQVKAAVARTNALYGPVQALFNHAGTIIVKALHETTEDEYDRLMRINVKSAFLMCREVVPQMVANGGGSIVITSSIGGEKGFALESVYCMTKGAVLQLARSIAVEYRDAGIRCNAVCPGFVKTDHGLREIKELDGLGQEWDEAGLAAMQGRICEPDEVAEAALFLLSDAASFISGTALYVDNGWYAKG